MPDGQGSHSHGCTGNTSIRAAMHACCMGLLLLSRHAAWRPHALHGCLMAHASCMHGPTLLPSAPHLGLHVDQDGPRDVRRMAPLLGQGGITARSAQQWPEVLLHCLSAIVAAGQLLGQCLEEAASELRGKQGTQLRRKQTHSRGGSRGSSAPIGARTSRVPPLWIRSHLIAALAELHSHHRHSFE